MNLEETILTELGRGRSATVFKEVDNDRGPIARKVFIGEPIADLVNYFFTGAPNPYVWSEDAIQCAHYRREVLKELVSYWFDSKLRVAESYGFVWNSDFQSYELQTEFIEGRYVSLHSPFSKEKEGELTDLVNNVMKPLQNKLIEAGFDGLVWQAGKGTPNALNNFLLESNEGRNTFVWIDLESGVPSLAPMNPLSLLLFYLPYSIKHGRPLFDDVDTLKLKNYIQSNWASLEDVVGSARLSFLVENVDALEYHQGVWKAVNRVNRSITYNLKKERITPEQADWYSIHPYRWYGREFLRLSNNALTKLLKLPQYIINKLKSVNYAEVASNAWRFVYSEGYRTEIAKNYVRGRIDKWEERKHLGPEEADYLRAQLEREESSAYITDFAVHIGIKPFMKCIELLGLPFLYQQEVIDEITLGTSIFLAGSVARTTYTLGRFVQSVFRDEEKPWVALLTSWIPTFGSAAYPLQMLYSASEENHVIAKFILYDLASRIGKKFPPIWSGSDTQTEHFFNHIPDILVRKREPLVFY